MSLEFCSDEALQIKCSYLIEKYKKKLQKVKQLKRELKASIEKKRKEIYMDRYFLNKEKEHLYSELAKEKEKIEMEHLEKTKELYNSYFADIFLYEQEYYQCIYKVFKNLLLKKEEIDNKERRVLKLQEHAWMTLSDRNVRGEISKRVSKQVSEEASKRVSEEASKRVSEEASKQISEEVNVKENTRLNAHSNEYSNANANAADERTTRRPDGDPINHPQKTEHTQHDKHFDIDHLCDLNINEIYQSIILDQGELAHKFTNEGDEFSKSLMREIQAGITPPPFLGEKDEFGSEQCSSVSRRGESDQGEEGIEKRDTWKEQQFLEPSSHGKGGAHTEELRNPLEMEENSGDEEAIQKNVPPSRGEIGKTDWHAGEGREDDKRYVQDVRCRNGGVEWDDAIEDAHLNAHLGEAKKAPQRGDDEESTISKSGGTEQCEGVEEDGEEGEVGEVAEVEEYGDVDPGGSTHFADQTEEIKCLANEETRKGEEDDPFEYQPNGNAAYTTSEHLDSAVHMLGEEPGGRHRRSAIDVNALSDEAKEGLRNSDLFENREVGNTKKDNAELDQVIENNIDFNISSYFSGSYDDIADCEVLGRVDEGAVALHGDAADADAAADAASEPGCNMIQELDSSADPEMGDAQNVEICTVGDPPKQINPNRQFDLELYTNQTDEIKKEEDPSQGNNNPIAPFNEHINSFYNEYEHMRRFNEGNHKIQSSILNTLYSYHNEYSIPIEKMQTFENYVEEIGQLENYERIFSFINGGAEQQARADCDDDPDGTPHVMTKKTVDSKANSNLGLHTVKELINYVSASGKGDETDKGGFKKKKQKQKRRE
ncbi:conserved Plasmodium protein, unknown function [Plasmodium vivax]|nr:conserved Plasmodium protein, unknown function [Plasmodium vivax]